VQPQSPSSIPGRITTDGRHIKVECGSGSVELREVMLEGRKRLSVEEFLRGYDLEARGTMFQ
jgi:methionyl-tRNA formyltransferase